MSGRHKKDVGAIVHRDGVSFRVWAPFATSVAVIGAFNDWQEIPLDSEGDGYWHADVLNAVAGSEYKYVIASGEQKLYKNDPRALQLTTSRGNSVIVNTAFDWDDHDFVMSPLDKCVVYELHVGTFSRPDAATTGTFQDIIDKLSYLVDLGVNVIELMPIAAMPHDHGWGYEPDYIYAVESLYGGRHKLLEFVNAAHKKGVAVVLDVVYNHFWPEGLSDIWQFDGWGQDGKGGIYFYNDWRSSTPWGETRPDYGRQEVREYILDNARMWLHDCHLDGLRVDSTIFIRNAKGYNDAPDTDLADGWHLLQQINTLARKLNPSALTVAEDVGGNEYITKPTNDGGAGFSAQWEVGFPQVLREALGSSDPRYINLAGVLGELGRRYNDDVLQRVIYTDSHDSAANGSARLNEVIAPGKSAGVFARRQSLLAAVLLLTAPGIPMLLQGQEFMMGGNFNDWEGLDWERAEKHGGVVEAYRQLIAFRKNAGGVSAGLTGKGLNIFHVDEENKVVAYHRWMNGGPKDDVVVVVNFGNRNFDAYSMGFPHNGKWRVRFCSAHKGYSSDFAGTSVSDVEAQSGSGTFVLPASAALIFSQD